jgi:hypothetical protein
LWLQCSPGILARTMRYSEFVDRLLLQEDLLKSLTPKDPLDRELVRRLQETGDDVLAGEKVLADPTMFALVRGGLFYALDDLPEAHAIFQDASDDCGSYWHGMLHRREGDFDNARYWFRRAGVLPFFAETHRAACAHSEIMARQSNWDPYLFTGQCEQERFGAEELTGEMQALQRVEFDAIFDYCWRQSALG